MSEKHNPNETDKGHAPLAGVRYSDGKDYSHLKVNNPIERKCVECDSLELTVTDDAGIDDELDIAADICHECGCVYT
ncbi:hypothetical protein [Cyclobacterium sp.]|uniref:hypothetical protein n=1 Tax=Cyclobacterium sp. TaxID=1966343 RepID=UPI0019BD43CA|nr:hypothetical protein [Cyclobacterium sp.]MBD3627618.1 hypothetical protein [Cyclobacterium sp.]